jgi:hypothetical protein
VILYLIVEHRWLNSSGLGALDVLTYLCAEVLDGSNEFVCDNVELASVHESRTFENFVLNNVYILG